MAKVFAVHGSEQRGPSLAELPWLKCVELFELDDMTRVEDRPKFGNKGKGAIFPTRIVVIIEEEEAKQYSMQRGTFESPLPVQKARDRLDDFVNGQK